MNLSDEETSTPPVRSTHAIDIVAFVEADEIPFSCFETPYYLAPAPGGERVYALLREALNRTGKIGIARVVIQARRQLVALIPCGTILMLNTLRGPDKLASLADPKTRAKRLDTTQPTERELARAIGVMESMAQQWNEGLCTGGPAELMLDEPDSDTPEILRPRVRLPKVRVANDLTNDEGKADDHGGYQAQRQSRPRIRTRRTYH